MTACSHTESALEALLFLADAPLSVKSLACALQVSPQEIHQALVSIQARLRDENHGIQLYELAGGWQFLSAEQHHQLLYNYFSLEDARPFSQAACEVLAIVAYFQPVTRLQISSLRGVNSDTLVQSLMQRNLLCEIGHSLDIGNPALLGTTPTFLDNFNLSTLNDLTPLDSFALPDELIARIQQKFDMNGCSVSLVRQHHNACSDTARSLQLYDVHMHNSHTALSDTPDYQEHNTEITKVETPSIPAAQSSKAQLQRGGCSHDKTIHTDAASLSSAPCITYNGIEVHFDDED